MAWYPKAVRKQLTVPRRATPSGRIAMPSPVRVNFHTAVSNSTSLAWLGTPGTSTYRAGYFNTTGAGGVFSHFYLRKDGVVEQMQDTAFRASCDLDGNPDTISIETWDGYRSGYDGYWKSDSDVPPLNPAQSEAMVDLLRWILAAHPSIPARLATSNRRGSESRGFSYHRLGAPGYALYTQAEGGLLYTNSYKKNCPGNRKIGQMAGILAAATSSTPTTPTAPQEEEDMTPEQNSMLESIHKAVAWREGIERAGESAARQTANHPNILALHGLIAAQTEVIKSLPGGGAVDLEAVAAAAERGTARALANIEVSVTVPAEDEQ